MRDDHYEGYNEYLCAHGHYLAVDCFDDTPTCHCGQVIVWWNAVNETNGEGEKFRAKLEVLEEKKTCTCSCCQNVHVIEPTRYKVPEDVGYKGKPDECYDEDCSCHNPCNVDPNAKEG